jgi:hypothetical protein
MALIAGTHLGPYEVIATAAQAWAVYRSDQLATSRSKFAGLLSDRTLQRLNRKLEPPRLNHPTSLPFMISAAAARRHRVGLPRARRCGARRDRRGNEPRRGWNSAWG